jgi:tRNA G18 (ribose-2'-O)-methylase SpoU
VTGPLITSPDDPRLLVYRSIADPGALLRRNLFVAEGRWVVQRLLAMPQYVSHSVLVTPTAHAALEGDLARAEAAHVEILVAEPLVMKAIVGFNIHRGCLALAERPVVNTLTAAALVACQRVLVLEGVNNPDNVGGIFRSAAAFDVQMIVLGPGCGDPLYRKAIRTSMSATLTVPYTLGGDWPDAIDALRGAGLQTIALTPASDAVRLGDWNPPAQVALLVGTESSGLTEDAMAKCDVRLRIPISNRVDSLNVTVATSIALHHLTAVQGRV